MGNRSASKTFPNPATWSAWNPTNKVDSATQSNFVESNAESPPVLDAGATIANTPIRDVNDGTAYGSRRQRGPRDTPDLYVYVSYRNWDLARRQIEIDRGLDYVSTNRRFSVLHVAVENNAPVDIVERLLAKGLSVNVHDSLFNQTPLHILMKVLNEENSYAVLSCLLEAGADVNARAKVSSGSNLVELLINA
jgi:hypothetical protein